MPHPLTTFSHPHGRRQQPFTVPMLTIDPEGIRDWLIAGGAAEAGIDDDFSSSATIACGLDRLLRDLCDGEAVDAWIMRPPLVEVNAWQTADSHGVDGGALITATLDIDGERVRLATLHQGSDCFTAETTTYGIDAAVEALQTVERLINEEIGTYLWSLAMGPHDCSGHPRQGRPLDSVRLDVTTVAPDGLGRTFTGQVFGAGAGVFTAIETARRLSTSANTVTVAVVEKNDGRLLYAYGLPGHTDVDLTPRCPRCDDSQPCADPSTHYPAVQPLLNAWAAGH